MMLVKKNESTHLCDSLKSDSNEQLYPRCNNFTWLSVKLKLLSLKARNRWTNKSFIRLLDYMLPKTNMLFNHNYEANKRLCLMGLEYMIHACPNDYVLYSNESAALKVCPTYGLLWFKKKVDGHSVDEEIDGPP